MEIRAAMRLAAMAGLLCAGACPAADAPDRAGAGQTAAASLLLPPASDGTAASLQAPLPGASNPDQALPAPAEPARQWSVLAAIALIVAAVAWSLLRQPAAGARPRR
jgi:hypothetical protein